jgi:aminoglycoside 6-adenylyltransferase
MLDVGYRVLLGENGLTAGWPSATYRAHIPVPPPREAYEAMVEEFWWSATYLAKSLWRGETVFAKHVLDHDLLGALLPMLEWRIELDHGWSLRPGVRGRGIERLLPPERWAELATTYVGTDREESWEALFRLAVLFREVATEVGDALGYAYPSRADELVSVHLAAVRALPPKQDQAREM